MQKARARTHSKGLVDCLRSLDFDPWGGGRQGRVTSLGTCFREDAPGALRRVGHWVPSSLLWPPSREARQTPELRTSWPWMEGGVLTEPTLKQTT